jgi:beta-N-acetylhexosaminidase
MHYKKYFLLSLLILSASHLFSQVNFYDNTGSVKLINEIVKSMTIEEKIGQVLMLGFMGNQPSEEIMKWVEERDLGGIKIFGWNADDLSNLSETITTMQQAARKNRFSIPLLIATDQEGGWVRHIRGDSSITPGNLALGATDILYDAWRTGYFIGLELRTLGINMNFAPVVDIYLNPEADVIGPRAFSDDPLKTAMLGLSFYKGMDSTGVISTAKHYPGHGDTDEDSHGTLPQIAVTFEQLKTSDLLPYKILISEKIPSIMVGHLAFPVITEEIEPASLSHFFITDLLRNELRFEGLIISDDLFMHGARSNGLTLGEVCEKGLRAGLDILLVSRNPIEHEKIWTWLLKIMKNDEEFAAIVDKSVSNILRTKMKYLKTESSVPLFPDQNDVRNNIPAPDAEDFFMQNALRSTSILKEKQIPLNSENNYLITSSFSSFFYEGRERFPKSDFHRFNYNPEFDEINETAKYLIESAWKYDNIIFNLHNEASLRILKKLESIKEKIIVFSVLTPVYLSEVPWVDTSIAVYGTGDKSFKAGFSVLRGDFDPDSVIPLLIKGIND